MKSSTARRPVRGACLVVEDSRFDQERIRRILARGFPDLTAVFVTTLEEAQTVVDTITVALILLDNNLPDGKGANFALTLSENPETGHIPVIMVSDWPSPFMFHKAEQAHVAHILTKADFGARHIHDVLSRAAAPRPRSRS